MGCLKLFRVDWGYRRILPGKFAWFGVSHQVANSPEEALDKVIEKEELHIELALENVTTRGFRSKVDPYCISTTCPRCAGKFGAEVISCANSLYLFGDIFYISVMEIVIKGYELKETS